MGTAVTELIRENGRVTGVRTGGGDVKAPARRRRRRPQLDDREAGRRAPLQRRPERARGLLGLLRGRRLRPRADVRLPPLGQPGAGRLADRRRALLRADHARPRRARRLQERPRGELHGALPHLRAGRPRAARRAPRRQDPGPAQVGGLLPRRERSGLGADRRRRPLQGPGSRPRHRRRLHAGGPPRARDRRHASRATSTARWPTSAAGATRSSPSTTGSATTRERAASCRRSSPPWLPT